MFTVASACPAEAPVHASGLQFTDAEVGVREVMSNCAELKVGASSVASPVIVNVLASLLDVVAVNCTYASAICVPLAILTLLKRRPTAS